jgi:hypothetical protein
MDKKAIMEENYFNKIRDQFCRTDPAIRAGKMMRSEAVTYKGKVFAFFSRKKKMVFKLGKSFDPVSSGIEIAVFNPFKKRAPLNGWFEVPYTDMEHWEALTNRALTLVKKEV